MSDANSPIARLFGPTELPVRIPDWPEDVGIAVCRANGRSVAFLPYHLEEGGQALRRRLPEEGGETLTNLSFYPALKGAPEAQIGYSEDQRITSDLENALRSMPRLVESVHDFAINFVFAQEEGIGLDGLSSKPKQDAAPEKPTDQLPVGYYPFVKAETNCEVISGAVLKPAGAAGLDLVLVPEQGMPSREIPPEANVLVREDSLRVAIPIGSVLVNGQLPKVLRLPAGSLLLGQTNGRPVPAMVLRRGNFLFVAPEYNAVSAPATLSSTVRTRSFFPLGAIVIGVLAALVVAAAVAAALYFFLLPNLQESSVPQNSVESLRSNLFSDN